MATGWACVEHVREASWVGHSRITLAFPEPTQYSVICTELETVPSLCESVVLHAGLEGLMGREVIAVQGNPIEDKTVDEVPQTLELNHNASIID